MDTPTDNTYPTAEVVRYAVFLAVNNDRSKVGLPPLEYTEFVDVNKLLRGAERYWTTGKRKAKALKQRRNKEGEWVDDPGINLKEITGKDLHRRARARVGKKPAVEVDEIDAPKKVMPGRNGFKFKSKPPSSPTTKVTRLTGDAAIKALVAAGHDEAEMKERYKGRGVIFQVDNPGQNPVHVFVASPKGMVDHRMVVQANNVAKAMTALSDFKRDYAEHIKAGHPNVGPWIEQLEADLAEARQLAKEQKAAAEAHYGTGGDEAVGADEESIAAEAAALFMETTKDWPAWKLLQDDGSPLPFMLEFDESKLVKQERNVGDEFPTASIVHITQAKAIGANRINFNIMSFRDQKPRNWVMPSKRQTWGQHQMAHEPGHLVDDRGGVWDSDQRKFDAFIAESRGIVDAPYVKNTEEAGEKAKAKAKAAGQPPPKVGTPNREWYAEMHAMAEESNDANLTPTQRVAAMAYLNLFMIKNTARPAVPTTEWITKNHEWLQLAKAAAIAGEPLPALPDPADFYKKIPRPKVKKEAGWAVPK